jgi:hypothetical protein
MWLADRASVANIWEIHGPFFSGHELRTGLLSRLGQAEAHGPAHRGRFW